MPNPTERFSNRAENYVKYRPHYPKQSLEVFRDEMNLQISTIIADIGAGTGISAKLFLENGNKVFGVEPNQAMREASENYLRDFEQYCPVDGTSENTTLDDNSIDLIICAQAFHWFDMAKAKIEFKRILRDKGFVALIWNERQLNSNDFLYEYEIFLSEFGSDYNEVRHENISAQMLSKFFPNPFQTTTFLNVQTLDFTGLKGRVLSSSYMPTEEHPRFAEMEKELLRLFTQYEKNGIIELLYNTRIYYGQF